MDNSPRVLSETSLKQQGSTLADLVPWGQAIAAFVFSLSNFEDVSVQGTVYEFADNTGVISISIDS